MPARRPLAGRPVTLGVTGGIAAYKSAEIVRLLKRTGLDVQVVMTAAATELMSRHALATLSEHPVATDLFTPHADHPGIGHIQLSRSAEVMLIAPATANILGKVAAGIADDLLSTAIMASDVPVIFAPAMNVRMWEAPAVVANVTLLRQRGYLFVDPEPGELACGEQGAGRMAAPHAIVDAVIRELIDTPPALKVLITAGPTEEPIDPVRMLSNRSSGKMGAALAAAARDCGHCVTLIAGPLRCAVPPGIERIDVTTAAEMAAAVAAHEEAADILVMAAAVADYRPREVRTEKLASGARDLVLSLEPNPDILATTAPGRRARGAVTIGFALEIGPGGDERARAKLAAKGVDLIVLNDTTRADSAFGADTTRITFFYRDGRREPLAVQPKAAAAREIIARAEALFDARPAATKGD